MWSGALSPGAEWLGESTQRDDSEERHDSAEPGRASATRRNGDVMVMEPPAGAVALLR